MNRNKKIPVYEKGTRGFFFLKNCLSKKNSTLPQKDPSKITWLNFCVVKFSLLWYKWFNLFLRCWFNGCVCVCFFNHWNKKNKDVSGFWSNLFQIWSIWISAGTSSVDWWRTVNCIYIIKKIKWTIYIFFLLKIHVTVWTLNLTSDEKHELNDTRSIVNCLTYILKLGVILFFQDLIINNDGNSEHCDTCVQG